MEPEESKKIKSKNLGDERTKKERIVDKTQWIYSVSGRKLRVLGLFPKSRFLILNSADMFPLWDLKTFI